MASAPRMTAVLFVTAAGTVERASSNADTLLGRSPLGLHLDALLPDLPSWPLTGDVPLELVLPDGRTVELTVHPSAPLAAVEVVGDVPAEGVHAEWNRRLARVAPDLEDSRVLRLLQKDFILQVLDADPNLIFVKDRAGRFLFVNQATARLFGRALEDVVDRSNAEIHAQASEVDAYGSVDRAVIDTGLPARVEEPFTLADGTVATFDTRKVPLPGPRGEKLVLGISVDVTGQKRAEAELQALNHRFELAIAAGRLGVWDWDVVNDRVYFSPAWKAQLGYTDDELPNSLETWKRVLHPDDRARVDAANSAFAADASRGDRFVNEFRLRTKTGDWKWVAGYGLVVRDGTGKAVRITGFHEDIQERKQLQEKLTATNADLARVARMKDDFLANMSHELRTPLNAILGQAEALRDAVYGPLTVEQRDALAVVQTSGRHLLELIADILEAAKLEAGHFDLTLESVSLEELCQEALQLVREQARRRGITIDYARDDSLQNVVVDARRMKQVLLNLLANAVKFSHDGGRVGLAVRGTAKTLILTVWDEGIGIDPADVPKLFQPFVQLDASLSRKHSGTGLGLALAKRIVDMHHGTLGIESAPGKGTRFTVEVPRNTEGTVISRPPAALTPPRGHRPSALRRIVVADDNALNVLPLRSYFTARGVEVFTATNGIEVLEACRKHRPDICFMDVQMPELDGLEATRRLRADPATRALPVIALTALTTPGDRERCLEAGASAFLCKPVRLQEALRMAEELVAAAEGRVGIA
jgi:PAS domain S-box-containing protein